MRSPVEMYRQIDKAADQIAEGGTKWPGMSYEEGVDHALRWALQESDDAPMEEDEG